MEHFDNVVPFNDLLQVMRVRREKLDKAITVLEQNEETVQALNRETNNAQRKAADNRRSEAQKARWARQRQSERKAA